MECRKFTLVEIGLGQNLHLGSVTFQVDEDERSASTSYGQNTTGESHGHVLNEGVVLRDCLLIVAPELIDTVRASEFVRVRVGARVTRGLHECLPVVGVLGWILLLLIEGSGSVGFRLRRTVRSSLRLCLLFGLCLFFLRFGRSSLLLKLLEGAKNEIIHSVKNSAWLEGRDCHRDNRQKQQEQELLTSWTPCRR